MDNKPDHCIHLSIFLILGVSISEIMTVPSCSNIGSNGAVGLLAQPVSHPTYSFSSGVSVFVSYRALPSHRFPISFVSDSSLQPTRPTSSQAWFWALGSVHALPCPYAAPHPAYLCVMLWAQPYPHLPTLCCRAQSPKKGEGGNGSLGENTKINKHT